ncbi:conserved protein, unknown function, partial [Hepatocystis sp. ex Piliocolobus tephrosceles]
DKCNVYRNPMSVFYNGNNNSSDPIPKYYYYNNNKGINNNNDNKIVYHKDITTPNNLNPSLIHIDKISKKQSCLDAIPCLNVNSEINKNISNEKIKFINYEPVPQKNINNAPHEYYIKKPIHPPTKYFETDYKDKSMVPILVDKPFFQNKQHIQPNNSGWHRKKNTISNEGNQKNVITKKTIKIKNDINELIKEKDKHILELEKNLNIEKKKNEIKCTHFDSEARHNNNCQAPNVVEDNNVLQKKLLDQKIKYEETLKHLNKI